MHFRARAYDPRLGRFVQTEPLLGERAQKHYRYALENPLSHTDPTGFDEPIEDARGRVVARVHRGGVITLKTRLGTVVQTQYDDPSLARKAQAVVATYETFDQVIGSEYNYVEEQFLLYKLTGETKYLEKGMNAIPAGPLATVYLETALVTVFGTEQQKKRMAILVAALGAAGASDFSRGRRPGIRPLKPVNLPSVKRIKVDMSEVKSGHMKGGSRILQGKRKADLFPENMTEAQVEAEIRNAYSHVDQRLATQGDRVRVRGTSNKGPKIEMWVNTATDTIETAYPVK